MVAEQLLRGTSVAISSSPFLSFADITPLATVLNETFRSVTVRRINAEAAARKRQSIFSLFFSCDPIISASHPPSSDVRAQLLQAYAVSLLSALAVDSTGIRTAIVELIQRAYAIRERSDITEMNLCEMAIGSLVFACGASVTIDSFSWKCLRAIDSITTPSLAEMSESRPEDNAFQWDAETDTWRRKRAP